MDISLCEGNGHALCDTCKRCADRYPADKIGGWQLPIKPHAGPDGCVYHYPAPRMEPQA